MNTTAEISQEKTAFTILGAVSLSHFINDFLQSLIIALYPLLKLQYSLSFAQIGLITLTFQCTASLLQPIVGTYTDKYPKPYSLAFGMACTLCGVVLLAFASHFGAILVAVAIIGTGSSIFHPESSRIARLASGGKFGLAQSIFQVGGNTGSAVGPLFAAWFVLPHGQKSIAWVGAVALVALVVLIGVGRWYAHKRRTSVKKPTLAHIDVPKKTVFTALAILLILIFSKFFYLASINSYLMFYLIHTFSLSHSDAQYHLFYFLGAVALGTIFGGPIGDFVGRKRVILVSIFGVAPFTLLLPYVGLGMSAVLTVVIGFMLASAFPAMIVYAQELIPGKTGMISGMFFGIAFGLAGIGAGVLGLAADYIGIRGVYQLCSFLPLLGFFALFLPDIRSVKQK